MHRTTIALDERTRRAARELAQRWGCTSSEAIRRAVVRQREEVVGPSREERTRRKRALERLFTLFKGVDPEAEVARIKREDGGF
jgi:hypothetical protein